MTENEKRSVGCLLGLAVGDAVGTTLEFQGPGTFKPITDMVGGGPFNLPLGAWTDDTSMALCLGASLIHCHGFDPADQMNRYVNWWKNGYMSATGHCFDIGNTVVSALSRYQRSGDPYAGPTDPYTAGNGSLMRLAPIPIYYQRDPQEAIAKAADSSRTTHGAPEAVDACRYYTGLLIGAIQGERKENLLSGAYRPGGNWKEGELADAIFEVAEGSFRSQEPPQIAGTGYVVKSLEAALWAFDRSEDFRSGCLLAANLGNDADTTAAIYGQLAGAYYGWDKIPGKWLENLVQGDEIIDMARLLYQGAP